MQVSDADHEIQEAGLWVPTALIREFADPVKTPCWPDLIYLVDHEMMLRAISDLEMGEVSPNRYASPLSNREYTDGRHHAGRVAWLYLNGWRDGISIDASAIERGLWPIEDGNHRLCAAILRGDDHILADIGGFERDIVQHFGVETAERVFGKESASDISPD